MGDTVYDYHRLDYLHVFDHVRWHGPDDFARRLGLPFLIVAAGPAPVLTRSAASLAAAGTGSAAEAAALAAAGPGARLLGPRIVLGPVTCAIAIRETS